MTFAELGKHLRKVSTPKKQDPKTAAAQERAEANRVGRNAVLNGDMTVEEHDAMTQQDWAAVRYEAERKDWTLKRDMQAEDDHEASVMANVKEW